MLSRQFTASSSLKRLVFLSKALSIGALLLSWIGAEGAFANGTIPPQNRKNVLVIHSYNPELSWTAQQKEGIDQGLRSSSHEVSVYHEFLDAKRYPDLPYKQIFLDYLRTKYRDTDLQVLIVTDDPGTNLVVEAHEEYFPKLPVVFMGVNQVQEDLINLPWITGVFETHSILETIVEAKRQTGSKNLIVVGDSSSSAIAKIDELQTLASLKGAPHNLVIVNDIVSDKISEALGDYPDNWPIYLLGQLREGSKQGALIDFEQTAQGLSSALPNPIYTETSMHLGHGVVGGMVLEGSYHAKQAIQLAEKILDGTPVDSIEPITHSKNQWTFDAVELQRAHINRNKLPPGSVLLNLRPSFYQQYRQLVWVVTVSFALSTVTIVFLKRHSQTLTAQVAEKTQDLNQKADALDQKNQTLEKTLQELRQTQAQLIHTEKMSSLGQLAAGLAHEINNPIGFIRGNISHIKEYVDDLVSLLTLYQQEYPHTTVAIEKKQKEIELGFLVEDIQQILKSVRLGSDRISRIVLSFRNFSRLDESQHKVVDLHSGIESTLVILQNRLQATNSHPSIDVVKVYGDIPPFSCEPSQLNQVFLNIIANAIDAIREQPAADNEHPEICIQTRATADRKLRIEISNNGKAIPLEIQERIFDPFFTTKPVGGGTGLGLSTSYSIIQKHGGTLSVRSPPGERTTFEIVLSQDQT